MRNAAELAFLRTIQLGSIRAAARELGQDPSGISRRITQLEQRLGAHLVDRSGNKTRLTEQGQVYFERLKVIIEQLEALESEVSGEVANPTGLLRVTASIDFGQEFLTDWLLEFRALYPNLEFELTLAGGNLDFSQNSIDVAIRAGRLPDSNLVAKKIADLPRVLVASPDYLAKRGMPETPADLVDHDFIFFMRTNKTQKLRLRGEKGEWHELSRSGAVTVNAVRSVVKAVLAGEGIHAGPLWAFADLIEEGRLKIVLPKCRQEPFPLFAVRQPAVVVPARISKFIDYVSERASQVNGLNPVYR